LKNKILAIILAITLITSVFLMPLAGCSSAVVSAGWAGVAIAGDNLYTVSGSGQLNVLTAANGNSLWDLPVDDTTSGGSGLGCAAGSTTVYVYGDIVVSDGNIYIAGYNGKLYIFDATTRLSSNITLDEDDVDTIVGSPVIDDGRLYIASSNGALYALDASTLDRIWKFQTDEKIWSTPAVSNGVVFVGSFDKKVYAVDAETGGEKWSYTTEGAISAAPVVYDGVVYIASFDRSIYALDESTGALKWKYPTESQTDDNPEEWFWATPVIAEGVLYAPCLDGRVYAVNIDDPSDAVVFDLGESISATPAVSGGKVIVATEGGEIYSLYKEDNQKIELRDFQLTVRSTLTASDGIVYVHTQTEEAVYAINAETGAVLWYMPIAG
jgi:outer membrane protein assembly factor BamB